MTERPPSPPVSIPTWRGFTPMALIGLTGLTGYALVSTALMLLCHVGQPYEACSQARHEWGQHVGVIGAGFGLLFARTPGIND